MSVPKRSTQSAKNLRKQETDAERLIWSYLRAGKMDGLKFRRQQPVGPYIVDFACLDKNIIIEIDGGQHTENIKDETRDAWLADQGFKILRFWNNDVLKETDAVLESIRLALTPPP